jgi:RNA polymerase sigma factor (sigma-70 family)
MGSTEFDVTTLLTHRALVRGVASSLLRDPHDVDDAEAETRAAALERGLPEGPGLRPWLATVARRVALRQRRSRARRLARERAAARPEASVPSAQALAAAEETRTLVVAAVIALDAPLREAVLARYHLELSERDAAQRLGLSLDTLRDRLRRARAQLRRDLERSHRGDPRTLDAALLPLCWSVPPAATSILAALAMSTKSVSVAVASALVLLAGLALWRGGTQRPASPADHVVAADGPRSAVPHSTEFAVRPQLEDPLSANSARRSPSSATPQSEEALAWTGTVEGPDGVPVRGATVFAALRLGAHGLDLAQLETLAADPSVLRLTTSDESGRFHLPAPDAESRAFLGARHADHISDGSLPSCSPGEVTLRLESTWYLVGKVHDGSNRPLAGAQVEGAMHDGYFTHRPQATSDERGDYRLGPFHGPRWFSALQVVAVAPGHPRLVQPVDLNGVVEVGRARGMDPSERPLDLFLPTSASLDLAIVDFHSREPVPEATVRLWSSEYTDINYSVEGVTLKAPLLGRGLWVEGSTDAQGRFRAEHLPAEVKLPAVSGFMSSAYGWVAVRAPGYAVRIQMLQRPGTGESQQLTVYLSRAATVRGRVLDETGEPWAGSSVFVQEDDLNGKTRVDGWPRGGWNCTVEADGTFCLTGVPAFGAANPSHVSIRGPSGPTGRGQQLASVALELDPGDDYDLGDVRPDRPEASFELRLRVLDAQGQVVSGARVSTREMGPATLTDEAGRIRLEFESDRAIPVTATHAERGYVRRSLQPAPVRANLETPLHELILYPYHRVLGRVIDTAGQPLPAAVVLVMPVEDRGILGTTDGGRTLPQYQGIRAQLRPDGTFEVVTPEPGPYRVTAELSPEATGAPRPSVSLVATAGIPVDLVLERPATPEPARLTVRPREGLAIGGASVAPRAEEGNPRRTSLIQVAPDQWESPLLSPGPWRLQVEVEGRARRALDLDLSAGEHRELFLDRGASGTIAGTIVGGVPGDWIQVSGPAGEGGGAALDALGRFELTGLGAGTYELRLTTSGNSTQRLLAPAPPVTLASDDDRVEVQRETLPALRWSVRILPDEATADIPPLRHLRVRQQGSVLYEVAASFLTNAKHGILVPFGACTVELHEGDRLLASAEIEATEGSAGVTELTVPDSTAPPR